MQKRIIFERRSSIMLSQKAKYALKALAYLAKNGQDGPILMSKIATEKKIPLRFLENIFHELKKEGFLKSYRGRIGGYELAKPANEISAAQIIRVVNGPIALLPCASLHFYRSCDDCNEVQCGLRKLIAETRDAVLAVLENRTLVDLMDEEI